MCLTISLSATVALVCLYLPKVYIIVFHPDKNVRKLTMTATYRKATPSASAGGGPTGAGSMGPSSSHHQVQYHHHSGNHLQMTPASSLLNNASPVAAGGSTSSTTAAAIYGTARGNHSGKSARCLNTCFNMSFSNVVVGRWLRM